MKKSISDKYIELSTQLGNLGSLPGQQPTLIKQGKMVNITSVMTTKEKRPHGLSDGKNWPSKLKR